MEKVPIDKNSYTHTPHTLAVAKCAKYSLDSMREAFH